MIRTRHQRERAGDRPVPNFAIVLLWGFLPIVVTVLLAAAVQNPILLVPALAVLAAAWAQRDRWNWPRGHRITTIAIVVIVLLAFLVQRLL